MNVQDGVHNLYKRYLKITIEWGGVENMFSSMSDLDEDLAVLLVLGIQRSKTIADFNKIIDQVVNQQFERENASRDELGVGKTPQKIT